MGNNVLVSGLTIVRNGQRLDYPFVEVIRSALSICDEFIVVVGEGDDVKVKILRIEPERRRLGLSLKQAQEEEDYD